MRRCDRYHPNLDDLHRRVLGDTYAFYSVATNNVGNVQATPGQTNATTLIALDGTRDGSLLDRLPTSPSPAPRRTLFA